MIMKIDLSETTIRFIIGGHYDNYGHHPFTIFTRKMVMQGGCSKLVACVYLVQHNLSLWFVRERKFVQDCTICKWVFMYQFKKIKKLKRLKYKM